MDSYLYTVDAKNSEDLRNFANKQTVSSLENGKIIYLPNYAFNPLAAEVVLLCESILARKHKNISYDFSNQRLAGLAKIESYALMQSFMHRFAEYAKTLVDTLLPQYQDSVRWGRTSYRPAEIKGRASSKRKDDTRVHVDSFSATPVNGLRILRVFCNINPYGEPRVWHVGEAFSQVLKTFAPQIPPFCALKATLLKQIKATKTKRSPYDHYMLNLHDNMKLCDNYQETLNKQRIDFPPQSSWLVFTDHVSHAALSGQFLLEQTFYLPVTSMLNENLSPLRLWEEEKGRILA